MAEVKIELKEIDPIDIFGVNDKIINRLASYYPNLKVIPRGHIITLKGSLTDINSFERSIDELIIKRRKKRNLNLDDVDQLFEEAIFFTEDITSAPNKAEFSREATDKSDIIVYGNDGKVIRARTKNQKKIIEAYTKNDLLFAIGPAGTGKTYTAIALAVRALKNREVKRLILTRPAVEAGERLGFLPGDLKDKLDPYLQPLYDALIDMIPPLKLKLLIEEGTIQIAPLAYMRGRTLENAFVILDEAQNTSSIQLKMFLTRMGNNAKFIVTGDATQIDLPNKKDSGLIRTIEMVKHIKGIGVITLEKEDIVRHPIVGKIVQAFEEKQGLTTEPLLAANSRK